ncbi:MAG: glycerate kinase type-2 family protein, partial [Paracoccaceae bacterium]
MTNSARQMARAIFDSGVAAADPGLAVARSLDRNPLPATKGRIFVVALGKAAIRMAKAACERVNSASTIIVTNYENATQVSGARVFAAGHPVPDAGGLKAACAIEDLLNTAGQYDHVVALISGGGSALLPAPVNGLTLADKATVNRLLLGAGLDITTMNLVRQQLSRLKGGGFLRAASPARITALILSDVVGDDLRVVASGPTVAPIGSRDEARSALKAAGLWDQLPDAVCQVLAKGNNKRIKLGLVDNRLIGGNAHSVAAMALAAPNAQVYGQALQGDVQDAAQLISGCPGPGILLFGGETTVRLHGDGMGGRNQELALRVALAAETQGWDANWVFLSGGTDGRDGPTDAAGGLVDGGTLARMRAAGLDPHKALANNDSYRALKASGDLLITGATGTNV